MAEREEAALALRESEERFRLIAEHAHDLIALLDAKGARLLPHSIVRVDPWLPGRSAARHGRVGADRCRGVG